MDDQKGLEDEREAQAAQVARLKELLELIGESPSDAPTLRQLKKEAHGYGKRRADREGSRDNLIYRAGYAIDAAKGLWIDPDALAGVLSSAALMQEILQHVVKRDVDEKISVIDLIKVALLLPGVAEWAKQEGRCLQWERLAALQTSNTADFKASGAFADPERWRRKPPTREQVYLIGEIARLADVRVPPIKTRGEAFDFIDNAGGNPRFWGKPSRLPRPRISR